MTLISTAGHLHPGGLNTRLQVAAGARQDVFRSNARYYEPAGAVSWDVSMGATPPGWRVKLRAGDRLSVAATYDTGRADWYEVMGIMPVAVYDGTDVGGVDALSGQIPQQGVLTHGHLAENRNHGGDPMGLPDPRTLPGVAPVDPIGIEEYAYEQGDMYQPGSGTYPPRVPVGQSLTFLNHDAVQAQNVFHTITGCKAPCNRSPGIAYPIANGPRSLRLRPARLQLRGVRRASRRSRHLGHSKEPQPGHLHLLLPGPPLHARQLPGGPELAVSRQKMGGLVTQTSNSELGRRLWAMPIIAMAALATATLVAIALLAPATSQGAERVRVMTRNVYLGADLSPGTDAASVQELSNAAGQILNEVDQNRFPVRAQGARPGDPQPEPRSDRAPRGGALGDAPCSDDPFDFTATHVRPGGDFLGLLLSELNKTRPRYRLVVAEPEFDFQVWANTDGDEGHSDRRSAVRFKGG